ncbi:heavy metal translocating P-type ATPase [Motiliproteus sediminis]|uniref:heavy metal translocating P-type ATPase n=1 Tax=Motiliproteus sediminis TaxID=1468178 RepID=UPI001AF02437|nr:heavy metal translocating P-type ATPase [Motiliproteus sediminis]
MSVQPISAASVATQDSSLHCYHCQLPIDGQPIRQAVGGEGRDFCCSGCQAVCEAIYDAGLESFYQRILEGDALAPPPELPTELGLYDMDAVQEEFVPALAREREIQLLVEGVHCAACVWLIENSLRAVSGVVEARVNLSGRKLKLRWNNDRVALSSLLHKMAQLGYKAVPFDPDTAEDSLKKQNRHLLYRMGFAAFGMMNLMWISIALYSGADEGEFRGMFHWIGMALATPVLLYSGWPFYQGALNGLRNLRPSMDLPIAIGVSITYAYSSYITISGSSAGEVYFDTVVNFLFVILVGRYLEAMSKRQAMEATQRLLDLQPKVAMRRNLDGSDERVPVRSLAIGDLVAVRPGERLPVDGWVRTGESRIDEAMLTGESEPALKRPGDRACAGTINGTGHLLVEVTALLQDTALGRIIQLVEDAQASRAPIQRFADRIVPWFVTLTLSLASLTFLYWMNHDVEFALMAATAVLIITCPCALGMATPMSIAVASGVGARYGVLVKNGEVLETLSGITDFVFDKTGTLTEGQMSVTRIHTEVERWSAGTPLTAELEQLLQPLVAVERCSEHATARAIVALLPDGPLEAVGCFQAEPGLGVRGVYHEAEVVIGSRTWMNASAVETSQTLSQQLAELDQRGQGYVCAAISGRLVAIIELSDRLRDEAAALVAALRAEGMGLTLLSGDRRATAEAVAAELGGMDVIAEVLPQDKDRVIAELQAAGRRVAMVGDGVNDAPALVRADVGIALGSGTDVSIASADIVLLSSELDKVHLASGLSRLTLRTIRQNIGISVAYNMIMVPLAMMGEVTPLVAAVTMPVSSLLVIGNAGRIRHRIAAMQCRFG